MKQPQAIEIFDRLERQGLTQIELGRAIGLDAVKLSKVKAGVRRFTSEETKAASAWLDNIESGDDGHRGNIGSAGLEMVGIRNTDATFGLGAQFLDIEPEVEVLQFPRVWVETITHTSPALLSWARARGASMTPTIGDGDMVLIDHSDRRLEDQDLIWAYTIYDTRGIKRLRRKGDRVQILSDNTSVPPDEEPLDFLNIIGRVVAVIQKQ